jgi:microcystin-dependent protein
MPGVFCLPNLKGKVPVGEDTGAMHFGMRGTSEGATEHNLTTMEMPSHAHGVGTYSASASADSRHNHDIVLGPHVYYKSQSDSTPGYRPDPTQEKINGVGLEVGFEFFDQDPNNEGPAEEYPGFVLPGPSPPPTQGGVKFYSNTKPYNSATCRDTTDAGTGGANFFGALGRSSDSYFGSDGCPTDSAHSHTLSGISASAGTSMPHNNIQPSLVVNYMIKL